MAIALRNRCTSVFVLGVRATCVSYEFEPKESSQTHTATGDVHKRTVRLGRGCPPFSQQNAMECPAASSDWLILVWAMTQAEVKSLGLTNTATARVRSAVSYGAAAISTLGPPVGHFLLSLSIIPNTSCLRYFLFCVLTVPDSSQPLRLHTARKRPKAVAWLRQWRSPYGIQRVCGDMVSACDDYCCPLMVTTMISSRKTRSRLPSARPS